MADQWLGISVFTAMGPGSIPGRRTTILEAAQWPKVNE